MNASLRTRVLAALAVLFAAGHAQAATPPSPATWAVNGHSYAFIDGNFTWDEALAAAPTYNLNGLTGYLATITGAAENTFVATTFPTLGWLGASDAATEGTWRWAGGPEAGQTLTWFNWNPGEPNNCCNGENYLQLNYAVNAGWNDHGGPGNAGQRNGFFVEFSSPVPEPAAWALLSVGLLTGLSRRRTRRD
jgi:hypothetical protein